MIIGKDGIGQSGVGGQKKSVKPPDKSGGSLLKLIKERRKALRDQHTEDQAPPPSVSEKP